MCWFLFLIFSLVRDGGGIEVDYKVDPQSSSAIEIILLNSGMYSDFAAEWSKHNVLTENFKVDEKTYSEFQRYVEKKQKDGDIKLEVLYEEQLKELKKKLVASKFDGAARELEKLRSDIVADVKKDFKTYKNEIEEDLEASILARYVFGKKFYSFTSFYVVIFSYMILHDAMIIQIPSPEHVNWKKSSKWYTSSWDSQTAQEHKEIWCNSCKR